MTTAGPELGLVAATLSASFVYGYLALMGRIRRWRIAALAEDGRDRIGLRGSFGARRWRSAILICQCSFVRFNCRLLCHKCEERRHSMPRERPKKVAQGLETCIRASLTCDSERGHHDFVKRHAPTGALSN